MPKRLDLSINKQKLYYTEIINEYIFRDNLCASRFSCHKMLLHIKKDLFTHNTAVTYTVHIKANKHICMCLFKNVIKCA